MSEWIDFTLYVVQAVLFWVLLPREGRRFGAPMIADRNPEWLAANPQMVAYLRDSTGFLKLWYTWAALSIAVLLALRLGWRPPWLEGSSAPSWEILKEGHGIFMILGMVGWFASAGLWFRWLARNVPLADTRSATLRPRTTGHYLSLSWRVVVETLTVLHLAGWLVVAAVIDVDASYWGKFAFIVGMTVFFAVFALLVPRRRPGYPDRIFGETYRRVELRVAYVMRLSPLVAGAATLGEALTGGDFDRVAHLSLVMLVSGLLGAFLFLRPAGPAAAPPTAPRPAAGAPGEMIGTQFGSTIAGGIHEACAS